MSMKKIRLVLFSLILCLNLFSQTVKSKTVYRENSAFKKGNKIYVYPALFDSTLSREKIMLGIDTLPSRLFITPKPYFFLYKDDTTKYAGVVMKYSLLRIIHCKYGFAECYKNGNTKSAETYNRKYQLRGGYMEYYENEMIKVTGKYRRGKKQGRWQYYDKDGKLLKTEKYKRGNLIRQIEYPSPKKNRVTKHIVPRENGLPYTLK